MCKQCLEIIWGDKNIKLEEGEYIMSYDVSNLLHSPLGVPDMVEGKAY